MRRRKPRHDARKPPKLANYTPAGKKRLVGSHFRADGSPKRKFASQAEAAQFLGMYNHKNIFTVYQCEVCDFWHLGTMK